MNIVQPSVKLVWVTPDPAKVIEFGARICYKSEPSYDPARTADFLDRVVHQRHHESVVEHAVACFDIICDRGVSHEIVRHRLASYSQESTRYCNYSKDKFGSVISVIEPPLTSDEALNEWKLAMFDAQRHYFRLLELGQPPELARSVLPNSLKTELRWTANFREWLHIVNLRAANSAHPQIRPIAAEIFNILHRECPEIFRSNLEAKET